MEDDVVVAAVLLGQGDENQLACCGSGLIQTVLMYLLLQIVPTVLRAETAKESRHENNPLASIHHQSNIINGLKTVIFPYIINQFSQITETKACQMICWPTPSG